MLSYSTTKRAIVVNLRQRLVLFQEQITVFRYQQHIVWSVLWEGSFYAAIYQLLRKSMGIKAFKGIHQMTTNLLKLSKILNALIFMLQSMPLKIKNSMTSLIKLLFKRWRPHRRKFRINLAEAMKSPCLTKRRCTRSSFSGQSRFPQLVECPTALQHCF